MQFHRRHGRTKKNLMIAAGTLRAVFVTRFPHKCLYLFKVLFFVQNIQIAHRAKGGFGIQTFQQNSLQGKKFYSLLGKTFLYFFPRKFLLNIRVNADAVSVFPFLRRLSVGLFLQTGKRGIRQRRKRVFLRKEKNIPPAYLLRFLGRQALSP